MTVFLSSHLLDEVNRVASHVGIIKEGRLIFQGAISELQRQSPGGLLIRCSNHERGISIARDRGFTVMQREEGFMLTDLEGDAQAAAINSALVDAGLDVYHMARHTAGLEELFNELTNGGGSA
jgi:ABC-2 type transport system ATP-binding protein